MDKALQYMALARKAGKLDIGEESCGEAMSAGRGKLLLLASDASERTAKRAESFQEGHRALFSVVPWGKTELGALFGRRESAVVCFTDLGLAEAFAKAMSEQDEEWKGRAEQLRARRDKAARRKAAPRKHRSNGDKGGNA